MSTPIFNVFIIDNVLIIKSSKVVLTLGDTIFPDTYFGFYAHDFFEWLQHFQSTLLYWSPWNMPPLKIRISNVINYNL